MGYYNRFTHGADAPDAGRGSRRDHRDLPEDAELPRRRVRLNVRSCNPTSDEARLPAIVAHASGFLYYVAITGITGTRSADAADVRAAVARLRRFTPLPVVVGFGIKNPAQAADVAQAADAAVVASALVDRLALNLDPAGNAKPGLVDAVLADIRALAAGVRGARRT
jgi:tryptophan synthase alpha chain